MCVRCMHGSPCLTKCIFLKSGRLVHNPSRHPRGFLTDPHPKFLQAEASAFLLPGFLKDSLVGDARPIFSFSVAFSDPSWLHLLLPFCLGLIFERA